MKLAISALTLLLLAATSAVAEPPAPSTIKDVVNAVGSEEKLLRLFRIKEKLVVNEDPMAKAIDRTYVCEPPKYWWLGKKERVSEEKEPATYLVWAWTLGILTDPKSKLDSVPEITVNNRKLFGIQVQESVTPPMTLYFDRETKLLTRIDWRTDQHLFSEWKDHDGVKYASKCVGYKAKTGKPWYYSDILSVERLKDLPKEYTRK